MAGLLLLSLEPRSVRRVRLVFSKTLAVAAFTSTSYYSVTNTDGSGASPAVVASLAVPNSPNVAELAVSLDLAPDGIYTIAANGVPAQDASTTDTPTELTLRQPGIPGSPSAELSADDTLAVLYGTDPIFQDGDFLEAPSADVVRQSGPENVRSALAAALISEGLPHAPEYGAHPREHVDGPRGALAPLTTRVQRTLAKDDRVKRVRSVTVRDVDPTSPQIAVIEAEVDLIGDVPITVEAAVPVR